MHILTNIFHWKLQSKHTPMRMQRDFMWQFAFTGKSCCTWDFYDTFNFGMIIQQREALWMSKFKWVCAIVRVCWRWSMLPQVTLLLRQRRILTFQHMQRLTHVYRGYDTWIYRERNEKERERGRRGSNKKNGLLFM